MKRMYIQTTYMNMIKLWTICKEDGALVEVRRLAHSRSSDCRFSLARYLPWAERKPLCTLANHVYNSTAHAYINSCGQFIHSSGQNNVGTHTVADLEGGGGGLGGQNSPSALEITILLYRFIG